MLTCHKFSGAGNTFLIIDDREETFPIGEVSSYCYTEPDDPVDGLILWHNSSKGDAKMVYYNRDGSYGEMCGNGLRCFVHFLNDQGLYPVESVEVGDKLLKVKGNPPKIWTFLQETHVLFWDITVLNRQLYVVDTGVPHAVLFAEDPVDVVQEGMAIRNHPKFAPRGVNVNFVWVNGRNEIAVRTYERGVEAETLACGTGAVASAYVTARLGYTENQVTVVTRSGAPLEIDLKEGNAVAGPSECLGIWQLSS